jgi:uncharacterized SAM-binding protein YcdF (DUF218 family)
VTYVEPALPLLLLIGFWGLLRAWRQHRTRRPWPETIALIGITFLSMKVGAWALSRPLEGGYHRNPFPQEDADAIVVLAGTVSPPVQGRPYSLPAQDTYRRLQHTLWLFRHWKPLPILVSGGITDSAVMRAPHSETMRRVLESEGIPSAMIWTESQSTNTHENARYGSEVLKAHGVSRIVLVTEATSMPRAARSFQKFGIDVVPAPARYIQLSGDYTDFLPSWTPIAQNGETVHELVGLVWYKLRGWI